VADGFCSDCGCVFDLNQPSCPRCGRCPACGKKTNGAATCPRCGHPQDARRLADLERRLNPATASNQKTITQLESSWRGNQLFKRLRWRRFAALSLGLAAVSESILFTLFWSVLKLSDSRLELFIINTTMMAIICLFIWFVRRQLASGKWHWLLKPSLSTSEKNPQGVSSGPSGVEQP